MRGFKKYRDMKVYEQSGYKYKPTPMIILKGAWLRELGFEEGVPITVECEGGRLTITRADEIRCEFRDISAEPVMCVAEPVAEFGKGGK